MYRWKNKQKKKLQPMKIIKLQFQDNMPKGLGS